MDQLYVEVPLSSASLHCFNPRSMTGGENGLSGLLTLVLVQTVAGIIIGSLHPPNSPQAFLPMVDEVLSA